LGTVLEGVPRGGGVATRHEKVRIVGIGDDGVDGMTAQARRLLEAAEVLLGP